MHENIFRANRQALNQNTQIEERLRMINKGGIPMVYFISALIFYAVVTTLIFSIEKRIQEISKKLDEVYDEVRYAYLQLRVENGGVKNGEAYTKN